jgi:hypothetical protein
MIKNFNSQTEELTEQEIKFLPLFIKGFSTKTKENPIKARLIVEEVNSFFKSKKINYKLTQPKLRKYVNHIRSNGILPLIATSKGYYISFNKKEIEDQITSLNQRANSILEASKGLNKLLKNEDKT